MIVKIEGGQMEVYLDKFFPCTNGQLKKLLYICDKENQTEIRDFITNKVDKLSDKIIKLEDREYQKAIADSVVNTATKTKELKLLIDTDNHKKAYAKKYKLQLKPEFKEACSVHRNNYRLAQNDERCARRDWNNLARDLSRYTRLLEKYREQLKITEG